MDKVVRRQHVRASHLPEDLRGDFPPEALVTVTVVGESVPTDDAVAARLAAFRRDRGAARGRATTIDEAVRRIRELRDEWD